MDRKIWIIGDSFTMIDDSRYGKNSWPKVCIDHFKGDDCYVSSMGSRDIETVFDIFLENLYKIKQDDFVILMLPTLIRFRLPLANPYINVIYSNINHEFYNTNSMIGERCIQHKYKQLLRKMKKKNIQIFTRWNGH
jgi:hypothetical protein